MSIEGGENLYELLIELSGLDRKVVESELKALMQRLGIKPESMTTQDAQKLMLAYLEEFNEGEEKEALSQLLTPGLKSGVIGEA